MGVNITQWRQPTNNDVITFNHLKQSSLSVNKVTKFSLCLPEECSKTDMVVNYCI